MSEQPSIGEVYRLCQRIDERLEGINGTVRHHDTRIAVLEDRSAHAVKWSGGLGALGGALSGFLSGWLGPGK